MFYGIPEIESARERYFFVRALAHNVELILEEGQFKEYKLWEPLKEGDDALAIRNAMTSAQYELERIELLGSASGPENLTALERFAVQYSGEGAKKDLPKEEVDHLLKQAELLKQLRDELSAQREEAKVKEKMAQIEKHIHTKRQALESAKKAFEDGLSEEQGELKKALLKSQMELEYVQLRFGQLDSAVLAPFEAFSRSQALPSLEREFVLQQAEMLRKGRELVSAEQAFQQAKEQADKIGLVVEKGVFQRYDPPSEMMGLSYGDLLKIRINAIEREAALVCVKLEQGLLDLAPPAKIRGEFERHPPFELSGKRPCWGFPEEEKSCWRKETQAVRELREQLWQKKMTEVSERYRMATEGVSVEETTQPLARSSWMPWVVGAVAVTAVVLLGKRGGGGSAPKL